MLTTWKQVRTSFESPLTSAQVEGSGKKKKKTRKSLADSETSASGFTYIAATFVKPLACNDSSYQERVHSSAKTSKKRRKNNNENSGGSGNDGNASGEHDVEPILCITSPHRVAFIGKKDGSPKVSDEVGFNLVESKSNSYVARPGVGTQFCIRSGGELSAGGTGDTFAGMPSSGAQYHPASNLIYALRNGGAELAVWTAAPSSVLSGPDDEVSGPTLMNGDKSNRGKELGVSSDRNAKKRKPQQQDQSGQSAGSITTQHLRFPAGKRAVTLTPFSIPSASSNGKQTSTAVLAVGAAGCCEDGSVWVATRFNTNGEHSGLSKNPKLFQLTIVDGSSIGDVEDNGANSNHKMSKRRKSAAPIKNVLGGKESGWTLMDSNAVSGTVGEKNGKGVSINEKKTFVLRVQSVMVSEEQGSVVICTHQVRVINAEREPCREPNGVKNHSESLECNIEKRTKQNILSFEGSEKDVAAKIGSDGKSLSIIHQQNEGRWMFTSLNLTHGNGALMNSISSFPLQHNASDKEVQPTNQETVFSFGSLGGSVFAIMMKHQIPSQEAAHCATLSLFTLRIVDARRKAELSSSCWTEEEHTENVIASYKSGSLHKMLQGKKCHTMITNELDGSIALVASSRDEKSVLDIVHSNFGSKAISQQKALPGTSLASALRAVASSASLTAEGGSIKFAQGSINANLGKIISDSTEIDKIQSTVDDAVESACKSLVETSSNLIEFLTSDDSEAKKEVNGNKGAKLPVSWKEVYHEGLNVIKAAQVSNGVKKRKENFNSVKKLMNLNHTTKRYIDVSFKETVMILLSLKKVVGPTKGKKELKKVHQEALSVLVEILQTSLVSARAEYGFGSRYQGSIFLHILRACHSKNRAIGALDVIDAMLHHVKDIPEQVLVSILRFLLRNIEVDEVVAYYSTSALTGLGDSHAISRLAKKRVRLSEQYKELTQKIEEKTELATKILSETVLDFTSRVIMYSRCNHSFLSKAMRDGLNSGGEVETLVLTLSKLLQSGDGYEMLNGDEDYSEGQIPLSLGAVNWISALTDAHMSTILKISLGGGLIVETLQSAVRATLAQSEFANELKELSDHIEVNVKVVAKLNTAANSSSRDTAVLYSTERLAF